MNSNENTINITRTPAKTAGGIEEFSYNLAMARHRRGMTVAELSQETMIPEEIIKQVEAADPNAPIAAFIAIMDVFGMIEQIKKLATVENDPNGAIIINSKGEKGLWLGREG